GARTNSIAGFAARASGKRARSAVHADGRRLALRAVMLHLQIAFSSCLLLVAGCPSRDVSAVDLVPSRVSTKHIPVTVERRLDILFVVDDSGSMRQEQEALAASFGELMRVLERVEGGLPDVHIGVVSSNVGTGPEGGGGEACAGNGDGGRLLTGPADTVTCAPGQICDPCPAITDGKPYIIDELDPATGARVTNYIGELADQFACMAQLGIDGCGFEQHLESMKRALENSNENGGFLREDAFLAVIFIQDEDDCSAHDRSMFASDGTDDVGSQLGELSSFRCFEFGTTCEGPSDERQVGPRQNCVAEQSSPYMTDISSYVDFLKGLKSDPSKVIVAAITGGTDPVSVGIDPGPGQTAGQVWVDPQCVVCPGGGTDCFPNDLGNALVSAAPAIRMNTFLNAFPQRSTYQSICNYN